MFGEVEEFIEPQSDVAFLIQKLYEIDINIKDEWVSPLKSPDRPTASIVLEGFRRHDPEFKELRALIDEWSMGKWGIRKNELIREEIELKSQLRKLL